MNLEVLLKRDIATLKMQQAESMRLLTACKSWVGTDLGEQIAEHLSGINGMRHNAAEWDLADRNGEQGR